MNLSLYLINHFYPTNIYSNDSYSLTSNFMQDSYLFNWKDFLFILPEIQIIIFLCFILITFSVCIHSYTKKYTVLLNTANSLSLFGIFFIFLFLNYYANLENPVFIFNYSLYNSSFTIFLKKVVLVFTFVIIYISKFFLENHKNTFCEYYILIFCLTLGSFVTISANDFLTMYLGLEIQALSSYVLTCFDGKSVSGESGLKYFLTGSFSSSIILFGVSLIVYALGTQNFSQINSHIMIMNFSHLYFFFKFILIFGIFCIFFGLLIKLGVAPFHLWIADIYEGALLPATVYFATVQKFTTFIIFIRIFLFTFYEFFNIIQPSLMFFSLVSFIFGVQLTFAETKVKRFLAFSSITHMGFILLSVSFGSYGGIKTSLTYFLIYIVITFSAWLSIMSVTWLSTNNNNTYVKQTLKNIKDISILIKSKPLFGFIISINFFSMGGIPPLVGFAAKASIFNHIVSDVVVYSNDLPNSLKFFYLFLILVGMATSVVAVFYYIRVVKESFSKKESRKLFITPNNFTLYYLAIIFSFNIFGYSIINSLMEYVDNISFTSF